MKKVTRIVTSSTLTFGLMFVAPGYVLAHCDSLDSPVVKAAQQALETRDVSQVLIWVQADDEPEIRAAFEQTLVVRALSPQGRELADRYCSAFFAERKDPRAEPVASGAPTHGACGRHEGDRD